MRRAGRRVFKHAYRVRRAARHAAEHAPARAAFCGARGAVSSSTRTGYGVLLGVLHRMPLRSRLGAAFGGARGAAFSGTRTGYGVLLGMLHCMSLRPVSGRLLAARGAPRFRARVPGTACC